MSSRNIIWIFFQMTKLKSRWTHPELVIQSHLLVDELSKKEHVSYSWLNEESEWLPNISGWISTVQKEIKVYKVFKPQIGYHIIGELRLLSISLLVMFRLIVNSVVDIRQLSSSIMYVQLFIVKIVSKEADKNK